MDAIASRRNINVCVGFQAYILALLLGGKKKKKKQIYLSSRSKESFSLAHGQEIDEEDYFEKKQSLENYDYLVQEERREIHVL